MLALKIFSGDTEAMTNEVLDVVIKENLGLEVSCYSNNNYTYTQIQKIKNMDKNQKIYHSQHKYVSLTSLNSENKDYNRALYYFNKDKFFMNEMNIDKYVIHTSTFENDDIKSDGDYRSVVPEVESFVEYVSPVIKFLNSHEIIPMFEKTIEDIDWFFNFFKLINSELKIGFCLDIGHCKVWNRTSLLQWNELLYKLTDSNIPIHFHIHSNDGISDLHYDLRKAFDEQLLNSHPQYVNIFENWFDHIYYHYENKALFTLESSTHRYKESLSFAKFILNKE